MAADPSLELQQALIDVLQGNLGDAVGDRVFDEPPMNPVFPYVTLGDCQVLPDKADCIDGTELYPIIHVWSQEKGFTQVKMIAKAVLALLDDQPPALPGFSVIIFELENLSYLRDSDGLSRHAAITFHALIQPS